MAISFQYTHEFRGEQADEVYDKVMGWLTKEEARKVVGVRPTSIEAVHGSHKTMKGWNRNAKKKLGFLFSPSPNGTAVSVTASPTMANSSDVAQMAEDARLNWGLLAEVSCQIMTYSSVAHAKADFATIFENFTSYPMTEVGGHFEQCQLLTLSSSPVVVKEYLFQQKNVCGVIVFSTVWGYDLDQAWIDEMLDLQESRIV